MELPKYRSTINWQKLEEERKGSYIYKADLKTGIELNASALLLLNLLEHGQSIDQTASAIAHQFPMLDSEEIRSDVIEGIHYLLDARLLVEQLDETPRLTSPLLITGSARSGTTALARYLSTHPMFCIFNEYGLFNGFEYQQKIWHRIRGFSKNQPPK